MLNGACQCWRRLSAFYFFYFAFLGAWIPFWNLYLEQEAGFDAAAIGALSALVLGTRVVGPSLWGWVSDHYGNRVQVIRWGSFVACITFLGIFASHDFYWIALVISVYSFFWHSVLSLFEAVTLSHLKENTHYYGRIRLWGSVGFAGAVLGLGYFFDLFAIRYLPWILWLLLAGIWLCSLLVHDEPKTTVDRTNQSHSSFAQFLQQLRRREVVIFFVVCFLVQFSHGPYYTFYSIYLEELGYQRVTIGGLWALGVLAEILLFMVIHRLYVRFSVYHLLVVTLVLSALRWFLIAAFPHYFAVLLFAQLLHAASFGSFHAIAIDMVRRYFPAGSSGQAQAFYNAFSYGAGGALGAMLSGIFWSQGSSIIFAVAGGSVVLALVVLVVGSPFVRDLPFFQVPVEVKPVADSVKEVAQGFKRE